MHPVYGCHLYGGRYSYGYCRTDSEWERENIEEKRIEDMFWLWTTFVFCVHMFSALCSDHVINSIGFIFGVSS